MHLDAPRLRLGIERELQLAVDPVALGEELVELVATTMERNVVCATSCAELYQSWIRTTEASGSTTWK